MYIVHRLDRYLLQDGCPSLEEKYEEKILWVSVHIYKLRKLYLTTISPDAILPRYIEILLHFIPPKSYHGVSLIPKLRYYTTNLDLEMNYKVN